MSAALASIADDLETAASATTVGNANEPGYWSRIAAASESLAGATTSANATTSGYMLRAALALESIAGTSGAEENPNENGYMKRIVDALEVQAGAVEVGSLEHRLVLAAQNATFGVDNLILNGTFDANDTTGWFFSRISVADEKIRFVNSSGFPGFARYTFAAGINDSVLHRLEFDILDFVASGTGTRNCILGGTNTPIGSGAINANGHYTFDIMSGAGTEQLQIASLSNGIANDDFSMDNIVLYEL